jgi:urease accessory protein
MATVETRRQQQNRQSLIHLQQGSQIMNPYSPRRIASIVALVAVMLLLSSSTAYAHPGDGPVYDLVHAFEHPFTGLDHLLAMLAVGLLAAQRGGRALWVLPLTFILVMILGFCLGMLGVALLFVEQGILMSVIVLGVLVSAAIRLPLPVSAFLIGLFALFHGHAHGTEIPANAFGVAYAFGFLAATTLLLATGIGAVLITQRAHALRLVRFAGAAIALCGLYLSLR